MMTEPSVLLTGKPLFCERNNTGLIRYRYLATMITTAIDVAAINVMKERDEN